MQACNLEDVVFANSTKVYTSADVEVEELKSTLVETGNQLWYLRFNNTNELIIRYYNNCPGEISPRRWTECDIKTYDDLVLRITTMKLLEV